MSNQFPSGVPGHSYNRIFETIVKDPSSPTLEEMASYFIYKKAKREWATNYCQRNNQKPDEKILAEYVATYTESRLEGLSKEGQQIVASFAQSVVEEVTPQILRRALRHRSFFREAGVAAVGATFYTLVLITIALIAKFADIDLKGILERVFK